MVIHAAVEAVSSTTTTVKFTVKDSGIGISGDKISKLFEKFIQADGSTTRKYGGTGLGLAISKQLTTLMGGEMGVVSTPGVGSTFWFTIPFGKSTETTSPASLASVDKALINKTILTVDDNATNRRVVRSYLAPHHCQIIEADCAHAALEILREVSSKRPIDLVLVDFMMPGMNGIDLGRRIREENRFPSLMLVMLTSAAMRGDAQKACDAGFDAYLTKPIKKNALLKCLATLLNPATDRTPGKLLTKYNFTGDDHKPPERREKVTALTALSILIADDNLMNLRVVEKMVKKMGHTPVKAMNGREVVAAHRSMAPDIILMDINMPEMDGLEATALIRKNEARTRKKPTPIIALTANALKGDREQFLAAGMDDYLAKPMKKKDLEAMLDRYSHAKMMDTRTRTSERTQTVHPTHDRLSLYRKKISRPFPHGTSPMAHPMAGIGIPGIFHQPHPAVRGPRFYRNLYCGAGLDGPPGPLISRIPRKKGRGWNSSPMPFTITAFKRDIPPKTMIFCPMSSRAIKTPGRSPNPAFSTSWPWTGSEAFSTWAPSFGPVMPADLKA